MPNMPDRKINQSDIARQADVSISTVSRALSGAPGIRPELRERIMSIAYSLGYDHPAGNDAQRVAVILPMNPVTGGLHQIFQETFDGFQAAALESGLRLFPHLIMERDVTAAQLREIHDSIGSTTTVIFYARPDAELMQYLQQTGPFVQVFNRDGEMRFDAVMADDRAGARLMVRHILGLGHRKTAFVFAPSRPSSQRRQQGMHEALADVPDASATLIALDHDRQETAFDYFTALFAKGRPAWSVAICVNDLVAMGLIQAARDAGLSVPGDLSVSGFDSLAWSQMTKPSLTTMHVDRAALGREVANALLRRLADPAAPVLTVMQGSTLLPGGTVTAI
ncbi:LacI family DNA-binding transcriptional regulator [Ketogulonicigenium vulgare]|uniref:Periplasmic binding protein/LacI transcriptional regulator n=1 Tax=Ketogulonicigenium vulgare (strain WSH-001) TaxID=759362 RepID=F9Y3M6_KETVW|nr:LacI family DNA-binding transcriptional regulator [Ketogulonicigenium vulgare]ADO42186.1 transcriptional regulator protein [Ketogulonicigenium vulgare Y25]AEM40390.1 Periplasmic binding protein/LacI transcriptional regulator [Ketogulonicigenium vulgare WSH-001]ALJ80577.1 LacI family transcriptional regulator [Ketogulonicigenium vulgare]ANW33396.1 LacI family transcriptional regulator [Ketogulonicigenium vulgare]AOZ54103.1 transcriptional regulator protein [Ketogulonicigenium vulgare]